MPAVVMTDNEVLRRAAGGDREALRRAIGLLAPAIWPVCYWAAAGRQADADDLLQETLYRAMRGAHTYVPHRPLEPWLRGIAIRVVADWRRSQGKALAVVEGVRGVSGATDSVTVPLERREQLERLLRQVDSTTRLVLTLRYAQGLSWGEISEATGFSREAVKKRLHRGKAALRKLAGAEGVGP